MTECCLRSAVFDKCMNKLRDPPRRIESDGSRDEPSHLGSLVVVVVHRVIEQDCDECGGPKSSARLEGWESQRRRSLGA